MIMITRYLTQPAFLRFFSFFSCIGLASCMGGSIRPMPELSGLISQPTRSYREPALGNKWLATLVNHQGKEKIQLVDLRGKRIVGLPGLNRSDSQPISVSVSADGQRLAFVRQRADQTELLLYRRELGTLQRLEVSPKGVPRRVSLDGAGRILAVQVSRNGGWDVDVIRLSAF